MKLADWKIRFASMTIKEAPVPPLEELRAIKSRLEAMDSKEPLKEHALRQFDEQYATAIKVMEKTASAAEVEAAEAKAEATEAQRLAEKTALLNRLLEVAEVKLE